MSRLVLFDVDGTLFRGQSQRLLLGLAREAGLVSRAPFAVLAVWFGLYRLGLVRRTERIRRYGLRRFRGVEVEAIERLLRARRADFIARLQSSMCERLRRHRAEGDRVVLVSASLEPVVRLIAEHLGVEEVIATRLEAEAGVYTGRIAGRPVYGAGKLAAVGDYLEQANKRRLPTVYYTDDGSDQELLRMVDVPICVGSDRRLRAVATQEGWQMVSADS